MPPLTPMGLARKYAQEAPSLDPWLPIAKALEEAFLAGYHAREDEQPSLVQEHTPPPGLVNPYAVPPPSGPLTASNAVPEGWLPLIHRNGERPCHKPAMFVTRRVVPGEPQDMSILRIAPDMREPNPLDPPICASCGAMVHPYTQADLDWLAVTDQTSLHPAAPSRPAPVEAVATSPSVGLADAAEVAPLPAEAYPSADAQPVSVSLEELVRLASDLPRPDEDLDD